MRAARAGVLAFAGALAGLVIGLLLASVLSVAGVPLLHRAVGIRFLELYLAAAGAIAAPLLDRQPRGRGASRRRVTDPAPTSPAED